MPTCNLSGLLKKTTKCVSLSYTPAGVKDYIYVFDATAFTAMPEPEDGFYKATDFANISLYRIDIKKDSGQVTSEKSEADETRTITATAIVDHSIESFVALDATMAFMENVGVIMPIDTKKAYVVLSPYRSTDYSSSYDSGTTYDSDHGFTVTFVATPTLYACPMIHLAAPAANSKDYITIGDPDTDGKCTISIPSQT